jgi:type VI protein secretion system component VasA
VRVADRTIDRVSALTVQEAHGFFSNLQLTEKEETIADKVLKEIRRRLSFLSDVGLDYLTLDRLSSTLSGGEAQRINLATSLGSALVGTLYVLEPDETELDYSELLAEAAKKAGIETCVFDRGTSAWLKPTHPASASSTISAVPARGAGTAKCTMISEPSASFSSTRPRRR